MKIIQKAIPAVLAASLITEMAGPALADGASGGKEEVVYVNLNAEGTLEEVYVVNIFEGGNVTDYGDYSSVRMLNVNESLKQSGDCITFSSDADRVYYQGTLKGARIPWLIKIAYYLDGKQYSPEEIAGKSGKLEIRFSVEKNPEYSGDFFDNYALQASFTLNTELCSNISAEGATVANVGKNKQISYTMLPGKGIDTVITADVTDFEMDAVSVNGIPLSLDVEVDDEELLSQISDLLEAIEKLDDGTGDLKDGVSELQDSTKNELHSGVQELAEGAARLQSGALELKDGCSSVESGADALSQGVSGLDTGVTALGSGISQIQSGLEELNSKSSGLTDGSGAVKNALLQIQSALGNVSASTGEIEQLVSASSQIKKGIDGLSAGINQLSQNVSFQAYKEAMQSKGLDIDALKEQNHAAISSLSGRVSMLSQQIAELEAMNPEAAQIGEYQELAKQLQSIILLLQANNAGIDGTEAYLDSISAGVRELAEGAGDLKTSYEAFDQAVSGLADTLGSLLYQTSELSGAISQLVAEYSRLDNGIHEYTEGVAAVLAGYSQVAAGVSELAGGSSSLKEGADTLYSGTSQLLSGITEFYKSTGTLKDGTGELEDGTVELLEGIAELYDGSSELKDGTTELRDETDGMDTELSDKIDEILDSITGDSDKTASFVSDKNTNVDSVQFIIQTEGIEVQEAVLNTEEEEEELTFWQKVLRLFGL